MIGYDPEDKNDVLELTYNYGITKYDKGNAYAQRRNWIDTPAQYQLFARYNILNREVRLDAERRACKAAAGLTEAGQDHQQKKQRREAFVPAALQVAYDCGHSDSSSPSKLTQL
ncbi:hypothetical protein LguiA_023583 [Lonicera macranthoides]